MFLFFFFAIQILKPGVFYSAMLRYFTLQYCIILIAIWRFLYENYNFFVCNQYMSAFSIVFLSTFLSSQNLFKVYKAISDRLGKKSVNFEPKTLSQFHSDNV